MVRRYKRKLGARSYKNYEEESLDQALNDIADGRCSIRAASREYKIPFGTLLNKYRGRHGLNPGSQTAFTHAEEKAILSAAAKCADWGFPLNLFDLRMMAKCYLERQGKTVKKFINNLPGKDWALNILERHKNYYGQRLSTNIKQARAEISRKTLSTYFANLSETIEGVPPSNIFNFDESNISDDPGKKWGVYRRGVKYPEKVCNHSKAATTIMVCGSASGVLLPPYVIYKSTHLYDTWKEHGPVGEPCCDQPCCSRGTRYNRTSSGWIDTVTFRDWFTSSFLPHAKRLPGRKVLIGDNLSSHLDGDVIKACNENDISFVCLVPNSTHLCQPLDVGFFRPMKSAWRATLTEWKLQNLRLAGVPKDRFPGLLTQCLERMDKTKLQSSKNRRPLPGDDEPSAIRRNLINSFAATGIYPLNKFEVLQKIPTDENECQTVNNVESVLTDFLKEKRFGKDDAAKPRRKKRLNIQPGKSIATVEDSDNENSSIHDEIEPVSDVENSEGEHIGSPEHESNVSECGESSGVVIKPADQIAEKASADNLQEKNFVVVQFTYDENLKHEKIKKYVAQILNISDNKYQVKCMRPYLQKANTFIFPNVEDICEVLLNNIIFKLSNPLVHRGRHIFDKDVI